MFQAGRRAAFASILVLLVANPALAQLTDDDSEEIRDEGSGGWPIPFAARPLTLHEGLFRLDFVAGGGQIDRKDIAFDLLAGAGYGIDDNFEVGIALINLIVSPAEDTGLVDPSGYLQYRFLSGLFQAAGRLDAVIPTNGKVGFTGSVPMQLSIADIVRIDLRPDATIAQSPDWTYTWGADGTLSVQILDRWRVFGGVRVQDEFDGPFQPLIQARGGTAVTIGGDRNPAGDVELFVRTPAERLGSDVPIRRDLTSDWFVVVAYRPFIRGEPSRNDDPFDDPEEW